MNSYHVMNSILIFFQTNPLSHSNNLKYGLRGVENKFVITSVVGEERIVFSPYYAPKETEEIRTTIKYVYLSQQKTFLGRSYAKYVRRRVCLFVLYFRAATLLRIRGNSSYFTLKNTFSEDQNYFKFDFFFF